MYGIKELKEQMEASLKKRTQGSYWTRTKGFKKLCKWAFNTCDTGNTGKLTKGELYTGLLLVYLNIASYAGPAACYPPSREIVDILFDACDLNKSDDIDEDEFVMIMVLLSSQLTWRILTYYAFIIILVPYVILWAIQALDKIGADDTILRIDKMISNHAPFPINRIVDLVPDSLWTQLPESIASFLIFSLALPFFWQKMDGYLEEAVEKKPASISKDENVEATKVD